MHHQRSGARDPEPADIVAAADSPRTALHTATNSEKASSALSLGGRGFRRQDASTLCLVQGVRGGLESTNPLRRLELQVKVLVQRALADQDAGAIQSFASRYCERLYMWTTVN